jgi:hypothetical protein
MMIALLGFLGAAILAPIVTGLLAKEAEGWIAIAPVGLLRIARRLVPKNQRDQLYDEEWFPELHEALHGTEGRPLTRLWLGIRFSLGLIRSARRTAREMGGARGNAHSPAQPHAVEASLILLHHIVGPERPDIEVQVGSQTFRLSRRRYGTGYHPTQVRCCFAYLHQQTTVGHHIDVSDLDPAQFDLVPQGFFEWDVDAALAALRSDLGYTTALQETGRFPNDRRYRLVEAQIVRSAKGLMGPSPR